MITQLKRQRMVCWVTLLALPLVAASPNHPVIGTIVESTGAALSGIAVPSQGTLIAGAVLSTNKEGSAWVRFSPTLQAGLAAGTTVSFESVAGQVSAHLQSGTMAAKSSGKQAVIVDTRGFKIEPAPSPGKGAAQGRSVYTVSLLAGKTTIVAARQGNVAVTEMSSGKKHLVPEGHFAKISNAPTGGTPAQTGAAAATASTGLLNSGPVLFAIGLGSGIGIGFGIGEGPLGLGPASPSAP